MAPTTCASFPDYARGLLVTQPRIIGFEFHVIKVKLTIQRLTQWKCQVGPEAQREPIILIRK